MDTTAQWQQEVPGFVKANNNTMGEIMAASNNNINNHACTILKPGGVEKKARPQEQLNCPRCNSTDTKFCYYNNYSLTQPRYFCKTCRRYWTEGGTLRNVPVGGGSRKNKKSCINITTSSSSSSSISLGSSIFSKNNISNNIVVIPDHNPPTTPNLSHFQGQDLNLAFPANIQQANRFQYLPTKRENDNNKNPRFVHASSSPISFITTAGGQGGSDHSSTVSFSSGFQFQEFKPSAALGFSDHGLGSNKYNFRAQESNNNGDHGGRMLFPFSELKHNEVDDHHQQHKAGQGNNPTGYWSGLLGGGSW